MIELYTNWYNSYRNEENEAVLWANLNNPLIDRVYLLCDDDYYPNFIHPKLAGFKLLNRPTYNDYFSRINKQHHDISIIANSDIYFDSSLAYLKYLQENECFALTRWNDTFDGCIFYNHADSQDAWIFRGEIKNVFGDFGLGLLGCDNRIAYELKKAGYTVKNPSLSIKAHHLHLEERTLNGNHDVSKTIPPPYEYPIPEEISPFMTIITRHMRTRPNMYENCRKSIAMQKDNDYEHILITDNVGIGSARANGLFNKYKDHVNGKYVFMLDDDDIFITDDFVSDMKKIAYENNNPEMIFVRMLINEELYPTSVDWKAETLYPNHIGTSCVVVRSDVWKKYIHNFKEVQIGDFLFIVSMYGAKLTMFWQDKLYSKTTKVSNGKSE